MYVLAFLVGGLCSMESTYMPEVNMGFYFSVLASDDTGIFLQLNPCFSTGNWCEGHYH